MSTFIANNIWDFLLSSQAILIYVICLLVVIILIVILTITRSTSNEPVVISNINPVYNTPESIDHEDDDDEYNDDEDEIAEQKTEKIRFYQLTTIDKESHKYQRDEYEYRAGLEEICNNFRNFASNQLKLYYDISDIRRFIASLSVTKLIILQGMSGTGKTSLAYAFGQFINNQSTVVPIQPMWKERTDLIGYYNEFTERFNETTLLQKMYEANYSKDMYITVLDEMNIARVEYYFAEFLSLLELPNPESR